MKAAFGVGGGLIHPLPLLSRPRTYIGKYELNIYPTRGAVGTPVTTGGNATGAVPDVPNAFLRER